uniref:Calcium release activated channel regulator 2B n=1 Tax=Poecilia formosa TaxID=48698 RepID=A0A096LX95_POEFO
MWLNDGEVLVGQGRGEAVPLSPRLRSLPSGSPRLSQRRSPLASPHAREPTPLSPQAETMGKAKELFVLCDKEGKGFITKRDMQRLEGELPLSPEQLETVFESLDRENNGFLTPVEFKTGLGHFQFSKKTRCELMGVDETAELSPDGSEAERDDVDWSQDPTAARFVNILMELGADKMFKDKQELFTLWCELQRDSPELLGALESLLVHAVSNLQDAIRERDTLEQALLRRESEHDKMVRSIYEEMESQIREEKEKWAAQDEKKEKQRGQQLEEELKTREQELENTINKQKELETRIRTLNCEQTNIREQNRQLRRLNSQLQEQVESSRERLQSALRQLSLLQANAAQEQVARQRNVMRVSRNIKKEKESLMRQLEILRLDKDCHTLVVLNDSNVRFYQLNNNQPHGLFGVRLDLRNPFPSVIILMFSLYIRDMNRRLRDEKDAQQSLKLVSHRHTVLSSQPFPYLFSEDPCPPWTRQIIIYERKSVFFLNVKSIQRKYSCCPRNLLESKRHQVSAEERVNIRQLLAARQASRKVCMIDSLQLVGLQRVFKVVFLGNSGVGKTSFIRHYCTGNYCSKMSSTVGVDFQMKTLILNSTTITLQLWDTAGQERYRSITEQYYRKADGILAMYDVTHRASFSAVRGWMDSVRDKMCDGTVLMLLGNKLDLADNNNREITRPEGERLAEDYQALFHECSAKTGYYMDELMVHLAEMLVTKDDRQCEDAFLLTEDTAQRNCCALSKKKI